ncbi:hypothetical protein ABZP36_020997 [Zizania latifolia]
MGSRRRETTTWVFRVLYGEGAQRKAAVIGDAGAGRRMDTRPCGLGAQWWSVDWWIHSFVSMASSTTTPWGSDIDAHLLVHVASNVRSHTEATDHSGLWDTSNHKIDYALELGERTEPYWYSMRLTSVHIIVFSYQGEAGSTWHGKRGPAAVRDGRGVTTMRRLRWEGTTSVCMYEIPIMVEIFHNPK